MNEKIQYISRNSGKANEWRSSFYKVYEDVDALRVGAKNAIQESLLKNGTDSLEDINTPYFIFESRAETVLNSQKLSDIVPALQKLENEAKSKGIGFDKLEDSELYGVTEWLEMEVKDLIRYTEEYQKA